MKTLIPAAAAVLVLGTMSAAQTTTDPCVSLNFRPCPILGEFGTGLNLQNVVDDMTMFGPRINVHTAQSRDGLFQQRPTSVVVLTFAYHRFFGEGQTMGIYEAGNQSNKILIFVGGQTEPGDQAVLRFMRNGDVYLNGELAARNFDNCFGLYVDVFGGTPLCGGSGNPSFHDWSYFSEDGRNRSRDPQMIAIRGHGNVAMRIAGREPFLFREDQFLIGVENLPCTPVPAEVHAADMDFNDAVVLLSGVRTYRNTFPH